VEDIVQLGAGATSDREREHAEQHARDADAQREPERDARVRSARELSERGHGAGEGDQGLDDGRRHDRRLVDGRDAEWQSHAGVGERSDREADGQEHEQDAQHDPLGMTVS
jgi:hypothetical protein